MYISLWILFAVIASLFRAITLTYQKHAGKYYGAKEMNVLTVAGALLFVLPITMYTLVTTNVTFTLLPTLAILGSGLCNGFAFIAYLKALSIEDVSIVAPFMSLSPVLLSLVEPIFLSNIIPPQLIFGALITVTGCIVISSSSDQSFFSRDLFSNLWSQGVLFAFSCSLFYTGASLFDKFATENIDSSVHAGGIFLISLLIIAIYSRNDIATIMDSFKTYAGSRLKKDFLAIGFLQGGMTLSIMYAFSLSPTATQVSIIIQLGLVINVFLGMLLLGEKDFVRRILGTLILVLGIAISVLV